MKTQRRVLTIKCEDAARMQWRHSPDVLNKWHCVHVSLLPSVEHQAKGFEIGDYLVLGLTESQCKRVSPARLQITFERELS